MYVVIMGCGRVGSQLAKVLTLEGHQVAVIDKDSAAFKRLGPTFTGNKYEGIGFDLEVLKAAGIEKADAFVSVTNGDNTNILGARIAKNTFRVPKVIARIYDPVREKLYRQMGIQTISSTSWAANKIKDLVLHAELVRHLSFGNGEVDLIEGEVAPALAGARVADLNIPGEVKVVAVIRLGSAFIPGLGTELQAGDGVQFTVLSSAMPKLKKLLHLS
ncbi:MAG: TrkA family potassium uptake protein [Actinomycetota bacterium]|nr:TrkA family potassium uptake protein [Actinomycetota bacterium]